MLNLLPDFRKLGSLMLASLGSRYPEPVDDDAVLDAFLFAAGMNQVLEDHLHRDVFSLARAGRHFPDLAGDRLGRAAASAALSAYRVGLLVRTRRGQERALIEQQAELAALVRLLAEHVARGVLGSPVATAPSASTADLLRSAEAVATGQHGVPQSLDREVVRLAQCFRSFDQRPEDCARLVERLAGLFPDRTRPILMVGLRTSGSYLAPLCGAFMTMYGYDVDAMTFRPEQPWLRTEAVRIAQAVREDRLVCLVDDPPRTGTQLAAAAEAFESLGVPRESLVLLFQLFGSPDTVPAGLRAFQRITLSWAEWSVHEHLTPAAVHRALARLLPGRRIPRSPGATAGDVLVGAVTDVRALGPRPSANPPRRGHVGALFRAAVVDETTGAPVEHDVYVRGVGIGYLGRHSVAVACRLTTHVPPVYAFENGLIYRAWLPDQWRLREPTAGDEPKIARGIAAYVAGRAKALAVDEDMSERLVGRGAVWEVCADMLSDAFGRAKYGVRPLVDRAAKRLIRPAQPCIVDGSMSLGHWFVVPTTEGSGQTMLKVDFDARAFSNRDGYCYDPLFDLASAAADISARTALGSSREAYGERLRREFTREVGEPVSDERWLLYQLIYNRHNGRASDGLIIDRERRADCAAPDAALSALAREAAMARAYQQYFARLYFDDLTPRPEGALCAIDVDWVLESRWLSVPAISPAGALALRALTRHGYRPVLATGRSVSEVQDRCAAYGLVGGVAEYGAAVYDHRSGRVHSLLSAADSADLTTLREVLARTPGVWLDPRHRHGIRAYCLDSKGRRSALSADLVRRSLTRAGAAERLTTHAASSQTDFVPAHIDKGTGLRALAAELGADTTAPGEPLLAFGIGDSASDLPMLALAGRAFAPANADRVVREKRRVDFMERPSQAGLLCAVSTFLGHTPSTCATCGPPEPASYEARLLLSVLGALDGSGREKLRQMYRLGLELAEPAWPRCARAQPDARDHGEVAR